MCEWPHCQTYMSVTQLMRYVKALDRHLQHCRTKVKLMLNICIPDIVIQRYTVQ